MDKRKYLTKTLIAEYQYISDLEACNYTEIAYRLKDNQIVMEFNGGGLSIYGLTIAFNRNISRKGIYTINESDYNLWKSIRRKDKNGCFIDWELQKEMELDQIDEEMFKIFNNNNQESILNLINSDDLPF
jgi:hypothetical protein